MTPLTIQIIKYINYNKCFSFFDEWRDSLIESGFNFIGEPEDFFEDFFTKKFVKKIMKNKRVYSNLMRHFFHGDGTVFFDDEERRLEDRKKALITLNNTKTYLSSDVKRYLISNFL
jgi:hypothetical protein